MFQIEVLQTFEDDNSERNEDDEEKEKDKETKLDLSQRGNMYRKKRQI